MAREGPTAEVRPATPGDAPAMGRVHVRAWQHGYRGQMPDGYLEGLDPVARATAWADRLEARARQRARAGARGAGGEAPSGDDRDTTEWVAVVDGEVVGIATTGPARGHRGREPLGELWMINVDPDHWGRGVALPLLRRCEDDLRERGYREAVLWCLRTNRRARRFYEKAGWRFDGAELTDETRGFPITEVRYRRPLNPTTKSRW